MRNLTYRIAFSLQAIARLWTYVNSKFPQRNCPYRAQAVGHEDGDRDNICLQKCLICLIARQYIRPPKGPKGDGAAIPAPMTRTSTSMLLTSTILTGRRPVSENRGIKEVSPERSGVLKQGAALKMTTFALNDSRCCTTRTVLDGESPFQCEL